MPLLKRNTDPTPRELRQFAAIGLPALALLAAWLLWRATGLVPAVLAFLAAAAVLSVVCYLRPPIARVVFLTCMTAAYPVGWVVGHILLAVTYYLVLTPIGLAMRALGRDPLQKKWDRQATTYWQTRRQAEDDVANYFRQF